METREQPATGSAARADIPWVPSNPDHDSDAGADRARPRAELGPDLAGCLLSRPQGAGRALSLGLSAAAHAVILGLLVLVPLLWIDVEPRQLDAIRVLLYNPPPPPPPPPLPLGSRQDTASSPRPSATPPERPQRLTPALDEPVVVEPSPPETSSEPSLGTSPGDPRGSLRGTPTGSEWGMEGGVEGGVPGGVLGGVVGGVIGGTGDEVVPPGAWDSPPRPIRVTRPVYPHDAFVRKIEGTVELGILIDARGRVARAWVIRSAPLLDEAALVAVKEWLFVPAYKHGRPVATYARAPISFRIY